MIVRLARAASGVQTFIASRPVELVATLPALDYPSGTPPAWHRIAHVFVPDGRSGDQVTILSSFSVTNDLPWCVELVAQIIWTPHESGAHGHPVSDNPGFNATPMLFDNYPGRTGQPWEFPGAHHEVFPLSVHHVVPNRPGYVAPGQGDGWYAIRAYAGGVSRSRPGDTIKVERDGMLSVQRVRAQ